MSEYIKEEQVEQLGGRDWVRWNAVFWKWQGQCIQEFKENNVFISAVHELYMGKNESIMFIMTCLQFNDTSHITLGDK